MSMLTEKRQELVKKLEALEKARKLAIDSSVEKYRAELEKDLPRDEIDKLIYVISALDEVIKFDESTTHEDTLNLEQPRPRPDISTVFTPSRE